MATKQLNFPIDEKLKKRMIKTKESVGYANWAAFIEDCYESYLWRLQTA